MKNDFYLSTMTADSLPKIAPRRVQFWFLEPGGPAIGEEGAARATWSNRTKVKPVTHSKRIIRFLKIISFHRICISLDRQTSLPYVTPFFFFFCLFWNTILRTNFGSSIVFWGPRVAWISHPWKEKYPGGLFSKKQNEKKCWQIPQIRE